MVYSQGKGSQSLIAGALEFSVVTEGVCYRKYCASWFYAVMDVNWYFAHFS